MNYTTCLGENQIVDVLESGRGNVGLNLFRLRLNLSNNSLSTSIDPFVALE
jgi:hypothetical protein